MRTMLDAIGNTPTVRLRQLPPEGCGAVYVKLEALNPTGSYKDRLALSMVRGVQAEGRLTDRTRLLECTGGSTGTSLAFVCAALGVPLTIISSDAYAPAKLESMRALGAELLVEPGVDGRVTPDLWPRMRARAEALVAAGSHLWLDQFQNPHAIAGYRAMGLELLEQVDAPIDAFCGCVGTAGMIVGVGGVLRERRAATRVVALEPDSSAVLSGREPGPHGIDGTAPGFVPPLFDREVVSDVRALEEAQARTMARRLARTEGLFAGTSTGMNVLAALELAHELGPDSVVATVACDTGFKYLPGDLFGG